MNVRDSLKYLLSPMVAEPSRYDHGGVNVAPHVRMINRSFPDDFPDMDQQIKNVLAPWRNASVQEALGVPAIFRAVTLIATTTGQLALEAWRDGVKLSNAQTPDIIKRPDPFKTQRDFYRNTAFNLATRGEFWWWVAKRDADGSAMSLINVPPWEITVDPGSNRLKPKISWLGVEMDPRDMVQGTYLPDMQGLRGIGPLQACGAAISVSVESQEWAANFFSGGGYPSILIKAAGSLGEGDDGVEEAETLRDQFMAKDHNTPRVIDDAIEDVKEIGVNEQGAQMLDARQHNKGDAANMFGVPGVLLEYNQPGSSLTYQSIPEVFALFLKTCLQPQYLEPIEHAMSDLLTRSTKAEFDTAAFLRSDPKTRWETYNLAIPVIGQEAAAEWANTAEGFTPGDAEYFAIPFSSPRAVPDRLPINRAAQEVRCTGRRVLRGILRPCGKLLAESGAFTGTCPRCGETYAA